MDAQKVKALKENEKGIAEEYLSSLADLNCNSKPLINMLTMLAEESIDYAHVIVRVVEQHIHKVPPDLKLPILYLIDSIVKNVKGTYIQLFSQCLVNIFCGVFETVNEKIRERMYSLRQTWNEVFSVQKLYTLDVKIKQLDQNWPITAKIPQPAIHVNPNFLKSVGVTSHIPTDMDEILQAKTRALLELKKRKLELELEATNKHIAEQAVKGTTVPVENNFLPPPTIQQVDVGNVTPPTQLMGMPQASMNVPHFRNPRPQMMFPMGGNNNFNNNTVRPRVHPVNPTLLNSIRHRDPRLARQQQQQQQEQQQQQQQQQQMQSSQNNAGNNNRNRSQSSQEKESSRSSSSSTYRRKGNRDSKSPSRSYSGRSPSKSNHGDKSSSKDKQRSHSGSSSGSSSSKKNSSSDRHGKSHSRSVEKDSADKSSPSSRVSHTSPGKSKDSAVKRTSSGSIKSSPSSSQRSKTRSRSNSPKIDNDDDSLFNSKPAEKRHKLESTTKIETQQRIQVQPEPQSDKSSSTTKELDKTKSTHSLEGRSKKFDGTTRTSISSSSSSSWNANDLFCTRSNDNNKNNNNNLSQKQQQKQQREIVEKYKVAREETSASALTSNTAPLNKVSFRINKLHKPKLDNQRTTDNFSTAFTASLSSSLAASLLSGKNSTSSINYKREIDANKHIIDLDGEIIHVNQNNADDNGDNNSDDDDKNKRKSTKLPIDEPAIKKSKQVSKIDALFGDDDVEMQKTSPSNKAKRLPTSPKKGNHGPSNLDDVRAKLAKAAKLNKLGKTEKVSRDLTQRLKLSELNANEDSQDAQDEKIRTILNQAHELLEAKSINQDQYRNLLQTVMSINENNKLKEAKRRESLKSVRGVANKQQAEDEEENNEDAYERERLAAREAILKKRIPKISKNANGATDSPRSDVVNSPLYEDSTDAVGNTENVESTNRRQHHSNSNNSSNNNNKRQKPSKWGDRVEGPGGQRNWPNTRPNNVPMNFRNNMPPQQPANNIRMPQHFTPFPNANQPPQLIPAPPLLLRSNIPPPPQPPPLGIRLPVPVPVTAVKPCNSIDNPQADVVRSITIDGQSKEIRIYGSVAIVFMDLDQPLEIGFKHGQRAIVIDNGEPIILKFNDVFRPVHIAGVVHQMRFGFPSRELYIDDNWYEIYFGGAPVQIPINGKMHLLTAEGPPPQVHIGALRRDLVVGKINMIVDALIVIPLFLDAHLQSFQLGEHSHTIQFADNLLTVLIDGQVTKVEYGGLPKSYALGGKKYFIRFTALPQGVVAGKVRIRDMIYVNEKPMQDVMQSSETVPLVNTNETNLPLGTADAKMTNTSAAPLTAMKALGNLNIDELFQKLVSTGILSGGSKPVAENLATKTDAGSKESKKSEDHKSTDNTETSGRAASEEIEGLLINPIDLSQPESIKTRQQGIINMLFNGMQCSSCGVRFPPEQTIKYSQHLDWHFRQNRRERDSARKAHSRKWYYSLAEWMQYKEIEDIEEREKNYFESQQQMDADEEDSCSNTRAPSPEATCAAGPDDVDRGCDMCHEKFEQFYNEELEEWHLRSAIRVEDKIYHPLCYEDYKASLNPPKQKEEQNESMANSTDDNAMDVDIKVENAKLEEAESSIIDDDDDDVIVLPNEEPSITELDDDDDADEYVPSNVTREEMGDLMIDDSSRNATADGDNEEDIKKSNESDADIEIQEPHIPFTDLDTYVEKVLPESNSDVASLAQVKIKEEPKDDDEDDGFEEVGTVLTLADEEITINSDDTQSQPASSSMTTENSTAPTTATSEEKPSNEEATSTDMQSNKVAIDGNQAMEDKHNLSATGVSPALVPLASLVNKIKINITKNINTSSSATTNTSSTLAHPSTDSASISGTTASGGEVDAHDNDDVSGTSTCLSPVLQPPVEETMTYDLKPALQKANLKKTKKIEAGVETSGLCSIM